MPGDRSWRIIDGRDSRLRLEERPGTLPSGLRRLCTAAWRGNTTGSGFYYTSLIATGPHASTFMCSKRIRLLIVRFRGRLRTGHLTSAFESEDGNYLLIDVQMGLATQ